MKRGPTTRSRRSGLFRLENVGLSFRMSMAAAHDNGSKRFGAHLGELFNVRLVLIFHFLLNYSKLTGLAQRTFGRHTTEFTERAAVLSPHFPRCMMLVSSGATMKRDESLGVFQPMTYMRLMI